jgi:hypothetical protein
LPRYHPARTARERQLRMIQRRWAFYDIQRYPPSIRFSISGRAMTTEPTYVPLITHCNVDRSSVFRPGPDKMTRPRRTSGVAAEMRSHVQLDAQHLHLSA